MFGGWFHGGFFVWCTGVEKGRGARGEGGEVQEERAFPLFCSFSFVTELG